MIKIKEQKRYNRFEVIMDVDMIRLAIIDDGVNNQDIEVDKEDYVIGDDLQVRIDRHVDEQDSHGTNCIKVLQTYENRFKLISIKIMKRFTSTSSVEKFTRALEFCLEQRVQLIHLSIGTVQNQDFEKLALCIRSLYQKGIVIVAAAKNNDRYTLPAALPCVIGVRCTREDVIPLDAFVYEKDSFDGIEVTANAKAAHDISRCNSYTAPFITALVCQMMNQGMQGVKNIRNALEEMSEVIPKASEEKRKRCIKSFPELIPVPHIVLMGGSISVMTNTAVQLLQYFRDELYYGIVVTRHEPDLTKGIFNPWLDDVLGKMSYYQILPVLYSTMQPQFVISIMDNNNIDDLIVLDKKEWNDILIFGGVDQEIQDCFEISIPFQWMEMEHLDWNKQNIYGLYLQLLDKLM